MGITTHVHGHSPDQPWPPRVACTFVDLQSSDSGNNTNTAGKVKQKTFSVILQLGYKKQPLAPSLEKGLMLSKQIVGASFVFCQN